MESKNQQASPGQIAQSVGASSRYAKAAGLIPGQDTYKNQPMALAGVAQWIEHWPMNQRVTCSIPS